MSYNLVTNLGGRYNSLCILSKGGAHWSDLSLLRQTSERGSEAL